MAAGQYAGVYYKNTAVGNTPIGEVAAMSFAYTGEPLAGGSPRFSIPIDEVRGGHNDSGLRLHIERLRYGKVDAFVCQVD